MHVKVRHLLRLFFFPFFSSVCNVFLNHSHGCRIPFSRLKNHYYADVEMIDITVLRLLLLPFNIESNLKLFRVRITPMFVKTFHQSLTGSFLCKYLYVFCDLTLVGIDILGESMAI